MRAVIINYEFSLPRLSFQCLCDQWCSQSWAQCEVNLRVSYLFSPKACHPPSPPSLHNHSNVIGPNLSKS